MKSVDLSDKQSRYLLFGASVLITLALFYAPYGRLLGFPLLLVSTVAHEVGHGLAAVLVGGNFGRLYIHADSSGLAAVGGFSGRISSALVAAGGLIGPACAAAACFVVARSAPAARIGLQVIGALALALVPLAVRNVFGAIYVFTLGAGLLVLGRKASPRGAQVALVFLAVQLSLSVFSRSDYLFTPGTSDVGAIESALFLPYWFWGAVCGGFSVVVLAIGAFAFLRGRGLAGGRGAEV